VSGERGVLVSAEAGGFRLVHRHGSNARLGAHAEHATLFCVTPFSLQSHARRPTASTCNSSLLDRARTYAADGPQPPIPVYGPAWHPLADRPHPTGAPAATTGLTQRFHVRDLAPGPFWIGPVRLDPRAHDHPVETFAPGSPRRPDARSLGDTGHSRGRWSGWPCGARLVPIQRRRSLTGLCCLPIYTLPPPVGLLRVPGRRGPAGPHPPAAIGTTRRGRERRRRPSTAASTWAVADRFIDHVRPARLGRDRTRPRRFGSDTSD